MFIIFYLYILKYYKYKIIYIIYYIIYYILYIIYYIKIYNINIYITRASYNVRARGWTMELSPAAKDVIWDKCMEKCMDKGARRDAAGNFAA